MKKIISALLVLVMVLGMIPMAAFAADMPTVTLTADKTELVKGEEITLTMSIDKGITDAYIWQWNIIWNSDLFEVVSMAKGNAYKRLAVNPNATIKTPEGYKGSSVTSGNSLMLHDLAAGTLCTLTLKAKEDITENTEAQFYIFKSRVETGVEDEDYNIHGSVYPTATNYDWGTSAENGPAAGAEGLKVAIKTVAACEHDWTDATCTTPKTCSKCGTTEGEAIADAHKYVDGACVYCFTAEPTPVPPTASGYTFATSADITADNGGTAVVKVMVTGNADKTITTYNAYDVTLTFDADKLEYKGYAGAVKNDNGEVKVDGNTIRIVGCGADKGFGTEIAALTFETKAAGQANVTITEACVSDKKAAAGTDIPKAEADTNADATPGQTVIVVPYSVTKPAFVSGNDQIIHGETYTFFYTDTNNYTYSELTVKVGGTVVTPTEANGTYTIANVTGAIEITAKQTAKSYDVTKPTNVTGPDQATYGEDYKFTVTPSTDMAIDTVTVKYADGSVVPYTVNENGEYVIAGDKISGPFTITVTETNTKTTINFVGIETTEIEGGQVTVSAEIGKDFTFKLIKEAAYSYTVKVGETELNESTTTAGQYTIPANLVVAGGVTVNITKSDSSKVTVDVHEYISLDGKAMFLVTAKWRDKVLAYGEEIMIYSSKYTVTGYEEAGAYCWLVVSTDALKTKDAVKTAAESAIVEATAGTTATAVKYNYDINGTTKVDVNDAQLAYDMYNASYMEFTGNLPMLKFLEADMKTDAKLDTLDVAAIISRIVNGTAAPNPEK